MEQFTENAIVTVAASPWPGTVLQAAETPQLQEERTADRIPYQEA